MAAAGFQLVTSLKMETDCLLFKLERLGVLIETDNEMNIEWNCILLKMLSCTALPSNLKVVYIV